jgi:toxin FitB
MRPFSTGSAARTRDCPIGFPDCQIVAIARAHGAAMATRNVTDFEGCGVAVIDPWRHEGRS